ncbi:hypothetical protein TanjilG_11557 [Lupinus angustifolius]|uniref:Uncharacterized protein n=1 Tax=Lupinus angustifolius TaxID=3871 RepID=A0A1J7H3X5_LUPAN|nr:hypothetical protein TanjilG_11557 [Lupinus angustifolius]
MTRGHYECLSSEEHALSYNISMSEMYPQTHKLGYRRHQALPDFGHGFQSPHMRTSTDDSTSSKQLMRFKTLRMFSCITCA